MICFFDAKAQYPGGGMEAMGGGAGTGSGTSKGSTQGQKLSIGHIYGKAIESKTKKPIEFVSVALYLSKNDSLIGGQLTETNGDFSLDNLPFGGFKLKITYLGYKAIEKNVTVTANSMDQDVGNMVMEEDAQTLGSVTITAEKSTIELKPDRKVFNVDKDLSAKGGTGVDVMKNIPGVSTDADGNVTLRNNSPIIYVDGKPTTLTLDQIPADQIDKVEVITNPSAKFEASATGGIINVVLKKNRQPGYNGIVSAGIGTNNQYTGMAIINVHEKKFGVLLSYNLNGSTNRTYNYTDRTTLLSSIPIGYYHQDDHVSNQRLFHVARIGFDYYVNNRNTISLSENGVFGNFSTRDNQAYETDSASHSQINNGTRISNQNVGFRNFTTDLSFRHTYPKPDKEWTIDINYNHANGITNYIYNFNTYRPDGSFVPYSLTSNPSNPEFEFEDGKTKTDMITGQWDFTNPIKSNMKLEFGLRSNYQRQYSSLGVTDSVQGSGDIQNIFLTNNYRIDNLINAAYITFSHTVKKFSYQIGLRVEQTYFRGELLNKNDSTFSYQYPSSLSNIYDCLFPSLSLSEKFNDKHELQFNITRKINRPNFIQIAPFIFASDKFNYRIGNPALQPEFDNKAELNYDMTLKNFTWLSSLYGSYNQQPITPYAYFQNDSSQVLINTFENAKSSLQYGWENTFKFSPVKGLDITLDGTVFYTSIFSNVVDRFSNTPDSVMQINNRGWSGTFKGIISYKFPLGIVGQINGTYEAQRVIAQGHTLPLYFVDLSVSKEIGIIAFNFTISDILNSKVHGNYYDTPTYLQTQTRRRDQRYARLGITVKFGKMDSSLFKKKKKTGSGEQNGGEDLGF